MVSLEFEDFSPGKRRSQGPLEEEEDGIEIAKRPRFRAVEERSTALDVELHLETPFSSGRRLCFDCTPAQADFQRNSGTHAKTRQDERQGSTEPNNHPPSHELNLLPYNSPKTSAITTKEERSEELKFLFLSRILPSSNKDEAKKTEDRLGMRGRPSWLEINGGEGPEMVATVCVRCHMLVMLSKVSPKCPNCKFMHSSFEEQQGAPKPSSLLLF